MDILISLALPLLAPVTKTHTHIHTHTHTHTQKIRESKQIFHKVLRKHIRSKYQSNDDQDIETREQIS